MKKWASLRGEQRGGNKEMGLRSFPVSGLNRKAGREAATGWRWDVEFRMYWVEKPMDIQEEVLGR